MRLFLSHPEVSSAPDLLSSPEFSQGSLDQAGRGTPDLEGGVAPQTDRLLTSSLYFGLQQALVELEVQRSASLVLKLIRHLSLAWPPLPQTQLSGSSTLSK